MKEIVKKLAQLGYEESDLPSSIATRIESLYSVSGKIKEAKVDFDANPTEEAAETLQDLEDYFNDYLQQTLEDIDLFDAKQKEKNAQLEAKAKADAKAKEEADAKAKEESDAKAKAEKEASKNKPQEKKGGIGLGGFLIGAVVLIATAGAYNAFKNK